jgi:hypothetical protein
MQFVHYAVFGIAYLRDDGYREALGRSETDFAQTIRCCIYD